jgi:hypothetical protein
MTGGGSGRAGLTNGGFLEPGRAAVGRCAGPALPLARRTGRGLGARPGLGPARPGRSSTEGPDSGPRDGLTLTAVHQKVVVEFPLTNDPA